MSASPGIIIQNSYYSFEEIRKSIPSRQDSYEQHCLTFCHSWLNGLKEIHLHTSGSTGEPKPIRLNRDQLLASVEGSKSALGLSEGMHCLICINIKYIGGIMMLIRSMEVGMTATLVYPSSLPFQNLEHKFDFLSFVPLQLSSLIESGYSDQLNKSKVIIIGGAPISHDLEAAIQNLQADCFHTYGMTETCSHIALRKLNGINASSNFKAVEGISLRINQEECLEIFGNVTRKEWIRTNDLAELSGDHEFIWKGRADDVVNSGGVKIYLPLLEKDIHRILNDRGIKCNFFLASSKDERLGERLVMITESKDSMSEILPVLKNKLEDFQSPKAIFNMEKFALTETGKIKKKEILRQLSIL